jgi:hypothetical protein
VTGLLTQRLERFNHRAEQARINRRLTHELADHEATFGINAGLRVFGLRTIVQHATRYAQDTTAARGHWR